MLLLKHRRRWWSNVTLTLPVDDGTSGQALITDGNGVLSFGAQVQ